jgi:hypothetical protein
MSIALPITNAGALLACTGTPWQCFQGFVIITIVAVGMVVVIDVLGRI